MSEPVLIFNPSVQRYVDANLKCDFCGVTNRDLVKPDSQVSDLPLWPNHFEQHLNPPRTVNICARCHVSLHRRGNRMRKEMLCV